LDSLFIVRFDRSGLLPQSNGKRRAGSHFISPVCWGGGGRGKEGGGEETKGHPRIISIAVKGQTIHTWSDRASIYFVSEKDNI
jgi:hypothetical protein